MSIFTKISAWTASHNPRWLALIRLALGAALLLRGVTFLDNPADLDKLISTTALAGYNNILIHVIPWTHIVGGFLLILGLFTRLAAVLQIPIILGAIIFVHFQKPIFKMEIDLAYSILLILLLLVFVIEGSGPLSLAGYFREMDEEETATA
ncbi:MAG: hypothetical protein RLY16_286 [Bacteroidota bacterium]|jgi:uncharacterized membrane protein YphA (DoxX/SURF4 family)